ncbi:IS66 family transposase [Candidatus Woesearchaeota archaeon]|nr:IS66 family transposase [Candidatus Woesearchaeota archaeon]
MECLQDFQQRHKQFFQLHDTLFSAYSGLHIIHEQQKLELIEYKAQAHYWESQFKRMKTTEKKLNAEVEELKAQLRKREQQLFGKKTERTKKSEQQAQTKPKKNRGQQKGKPGHGRRDYSHLPVVEEEIDFVDEDKYCPCCGLPYEELPGTEDSEVLEVINVKAHRRLIHRKMYRKTCGCNGSKRQLVVVPAAEKLLPKSKFGITIWAYLLLQKYEYQIPTHRALKQLKANGLSLAMGTLTDGFKKLLPYLSPVYDVIVERSLKAKHWHADETGWKVFEPLEGRSSKRWYLWIFSNNDTVIYKLDPSRSSKVLINHFGEDASGTLNVDRYAAYKVIAKSGLFMLAFCWAHVRRDFLGHSKAYPDQESWGLSWVERIGELYNFNKKRLRYGFGSRSFLKCDKLLREKVSKFYKELEKQLEDKETECSSRKVLESLRNHWEGLTIFIDRPEIPMDNNEAERGLRTSVIGRKNYYGSSSIWSGELATSMFTIFETMKKWDINPHTWLLAYLQECAMLGEPPEDIEKYMPWNMTEKQRHLFSQPPIGENTS